MTVADAQSGQLSRILSCLPPGGEWFNGEEGLVTRVRGVPFAGEAFGLGDLFRGHPECNPVAILDDELSRLTGQL